MTETNGFNMISETIPNPNTSYDTSDNEDDIGKSTKTTQTTDYINSNDFNHNANDTNNVTINNTVDNLDNDKKD